MIEPSALGVKEVVMDRSLMAWLDDYRRQGIDAVAREDELWQRFGRRCATLVLDSSGFTKSTAAHGMIYFLSKIAALRSIAEPIIQQHGAVRYAFEADNIIGLFPTVLDAYAVAQGITDGLRQQRVMLEEGELFHVCGGIGYGDILVDRGFGEFYGFEMNLASKLGEDISGPDELYFTSAAYDAMGADERPACEAVQLEIAGQQRRCYLLNM